MSPNLISPYESLAESQSAIRVLVVAPGEYEDDIYGWLLHVDLDADTEGAPLPTHNLVNYPYPFRAQWPGGQQREYKLDIDGVLTPQDDGMALSRHPFQRYTALSYNLHAALQTLRDHGDSGAGAGLKVWIDAVCINQADHKEKEQQLQLMRRVYQQAQDVVAYVPQEPEDERNLLEVFRTILKAEDRFKRHYANVEDGGFVNTVRADFSNSDMPYWASFLMAQDHIHQQRAADSEVLFLEDFNLPPENSPLWTSWRRFFASPYFRRIRILQEFTLASTLTPRLGPHFSLNANTFIKAHYYLQFHSGAKNGNYLGQFPPSTPEDFIQKVLAGVRCAGIMEAGRFSDRDRHGMKLVQKLYDAREFQATDPRDKVYAVLWLAMDEDDEVFKGLVSYGPEVTAGEVFLRYARAMVKKGDGFEVLVQAGLLKDDSLPSWVPDWSRAILPSGEKTPDILPTSTGIRVTDDDRLLIPGAFVDEIKAISRDAFLHPRDSHPTSGVQRH
ncbi:hypothetical protein OQA88_2591 [Cercophora sp. LCS_1]